LVKTDLIAVGILDAEETAGRKFHDLERDFDARAADFSQRGVQIGDFEGEARRGRSGPGIGDRERLPGDIVFDPPRAGRHFDLKGDLETEQAFLKFPRARNVRDRVKDKRESLDLKAHGAERGPRTCAVNGYGERRDLGGTGERTLAVAGIDFGLS
jgi:hypothetical protein